MKCLALLACAMSLCAQNYKVQTASGLVEMPAEAYVAGVVSGESGEFKSAEARKAMAVAARTYAARMRGRHQKDGFDFCSLTHCQRFVKASAQSTEAARQTEGELLLFHGRPALTVYSRSCGGRTEGNTDEPYLISHPDPYCSLAWNWSGSAQEIRAALLQSGLQVPAQLKSISVVRRTSSGRAQMLSLDGELISASTFRFALGRAVGWNTIRSDQYTIENTGRRFLFRGSGEGHGIGLCQEGADGMGQRSKTYREILAFYYPGTSLDFRWTRLSGEGIVLHTMLPDADRSIIALAESFMQSWRGRLPWPLPASVDIYVYPDLDAFRNATAEPGWVAARTTGTRIDMQPSALLKNHQTLRSTVEHELLHCFVESAARPGLPVWFREGLVEHLAGGAPSSGVSVLEDAMRQRTDRAAAANAYGAAQKRVEELISRYGETAVLGWVRRGLPADVKYSAASSPAVKSK